MRTEARLQANHQETIRSLTDMHNNVTQVLAVVERNASAVPATIGTMPCCSSESSWSTTGDELDRSVITFAQSTISTSAPMLRTPNMITEELMTTAYIKLQISHIAMIVEKVSLTTIPISSPDRFPRFSLNPIVQEESMSLMHLRHHVVREITHIRDFLESECLPSILYDGIVALNNLSVALNVLDMRQESKLLGDWTITLIRKLIMIDNGNSDLDAHLAHYLTNQSISYSDAGNLSQSLGAIKEAYTITQNLLNQYGSESRFQILHSTILLQHAWLVDNKSAVEMIIEAIRVLGVILDIRAYTQSMLPQQLEMAVQLSSSFLDQLFSAPHEQSLIMTYAHALQQLAGCLFRDKAHSDTALDLARLSIAVQRRSLSLHKPEHRAELAMALSSLVQCEIATSIPAEDLVDMVNECIPLLRELVEKNPAHYARELVNVLWVKASTLRSAKRDTEAIATWEEVARLAAQVVEDSELYARALGHLSSQFRRLMRHEDAVRTGRLAITTYRQDTEAQALRYFYLSQDLRELQRYKEAAEAAQKSVMLYRRLAMKDPAKWMGDVSEGLSDLSQCIAALGHYSDALIAWRESVRVLDNVVEGTLDIDINTYLGIVQAHSLTGLILEDHEACLEVSSTVIQSLRRLSELYPQNSDIIVEIRWSELRHASNLLRVGCLQDAHQYIDHWLDVWSSKPEASSDPRIAATHAAMVTLKADLLDDQGCTEQALLTTMEVHDIVRLSTQTYQPSFSQMIDCMIHEARYRVNLGNSEQALDIAEEALRLSRENMLEPIVENLVWSLHAVALTALTCRNYQRAGEAAQEGCSTSSTSQWRDNEEEHDISIRPGLFAILSSAEANLGRCDTALQYAQYAVDASLTIKDMKASISPTTAEQSYIETRGNLADILLVTGDTVQARQICEERLTYFSKRVEIRMGDYRELAPILHTLGILYCSEGRHKEGDAAAKELACIIKTLRSAFPSFQEEVKIRLRRQVQVPILKVLDDMKDKLECEHQAGVASLFAI